MKEVTLKIEGLTKRYGKIHAINDLSLEIREGQVFGLLGPNGSGKTTTLGVLLGVIQPNAGNFMWFGKTPSPDSRKKIGAILEQPVFYPYMSAVENLKVVARIKEVPYENIEEVLKWVNLWERRNDAFKTYSLGMKQRLAIASALLCDPQVMILDEPTNGLDPQGINEIRDMIVQIAKRGKTIILASHLLDEVQKVCSDFAILSKGNLIYTGNVKADLSDEPVVELMAEPADELERHLMAMDGIESVQKTSEHFLVHISPGFQMKEFSRKLSEKNLFVTHLLKRKKTLEKRFLEVLKEHD